MHQRWSISIHENFIETCWKTKRETPKKFNFVYNSLKAIISSNDVCIWWLHFLRTWFIHYKCVWMHLWNGGIVIFRMCADRNSTKKHFFSFFLLCNGLIQHLLLKSEYALQLKELRHFDEKWLSKWNVVFVILYMAVSYHAVKSIRGAATIFKLKRKLRYTPIYI